MSTTEPAVWRWRWKDQVGWMLSFKDESKDSQGRPLEGIEAEVYAYPVATTAPPDGWQHRGRRLTWSGIEGFEPRVKQLGPWSEWFPGRSPVAAPNFDEFEERPLYTHPPRAVEALREALEPLYRDIFAEITAKAEPLCEDAADPEKITGYRLPVGPLHRAAGKLGFQMFDGEKNLAAAVARIAELERLQPIRFGPSIEDRMPTAEEFEAAQEVALRNIRVFEPKPFATQPAKSPLASEDPEFTPIAVYERALWLIFGRKGKTLISVEHGQPYSIGANAAFEEMAAIAADALRNTGDNDGAGG